MRKRLIPLLLIILMVLGPVAVSASDDQAPYETYTLDKWGNATPAPHGYLPSRSLGGEMLGCGSFNNASDMFYSEALGRIFICDSGNARIVILDEELQLVRVLSEFTQPGGETYTLRNPQGIYALDNGTLYICDMDNKDVLVCDMEGNISQIVPEPESNLLPEDFNYQPSKVVCDDVGRIYVISKGVYQGLIYLDTDGSFIKFFGSNRVEMTLQRQLLKIWKSILSDEAAATLQSFNPVEYGNLFYSDDGYIYATAAGSENGSALLARLNPLGIDTLPYSFGGSILFSDVTVDERGITTLLDTTYGEIYQVNEMGQTMFIFGGIGDQVGLFQRPVSLIEVNDKLYVLDADKNTITEFVLTQFGQLVQKAIDLYDEGHYQESIEPWEEVIAHNSNYLLAYTGLGQAYYQLKDYDTAMYYFRLANDRGNYSTAFKESSLNAMRNNFGILVLGILLLLVLIKIWQRMGVPMVQSAGGRLSRRLEPTTFGQRLLEMGKGAKQCRYTIFHPVNGFDQVKWEKKGSVAFCVVILLAFFLTNVFDQVLTGFIFNTYNPDKISVPSIFLTSIGGFALCYVANWAVSSLMFTEGDERNIFISLCYTLVPYIICQLIYILLTNFFNNDLVAFLTAIRLIGLVWSGLVLVIGTFYVHQIPFGKTILNLVLTVIALLIILFLLLLAYSLVNQIYTFAYTIYNEIVFRI